jgi:hypothetical protein
LTEFGPLAAGAEPGIGVNTPCAKAPAALRTRSTAMQAIAGKTRRPTIQPIAAPSPLIRDNVPPPAKFAPGRQPVPGRLIVSF